MSGSGRYAALTNTHQQIDDDRLDKAKEAAATNKVETPQQAQQITEPEEKKETLKEAYDKSLLSPQDFDAYQIRRAEEVQARVDKGESRHDAAYAVGRVEQGIPVHEVKPLPPPPAKTVDPILQQARTMLARIQEQAKEQEKVPEQQQGVDIER